MILPYFIPKINLEVLKINKKQYYNQEYIAKEISKITGNNIFDIRNILNALSEVITNISLNTIDESEIKFTKGIKIYAKIKNLDNFKSNLNVKVTHQKIMLYSKLTDEFKKKINYIKKNNTLTYK